MGASASIRHVYKGAHDWFRTYMDTATYNEDFQSIDKDGDSLITVVDFTSWLQEKCKEDSTWEVFTKHGQLLMIAHKCAASFHDLSSSPLSKCLVGYGEFKALLVHLFVASILWAHFQNAEQWNDGETMEERKLSFEQFKVACETLCTLHQQENLSEAQLRDDFNLLDVSRENSVGFFQVCHHCSQFIDPAFGLPPEQGLSEPVTARLSARERPAKILKSMSGLQSDVAMDLQAGPKMYYASLSVEEKNTAAVQAFTQHLTTEESNLRTVTKLKQVPANTIVYSCSTAAEGSLALSTSPTSPSTSRVSTEVDTSDNEVTTLPFSNVLAP